MRVNPRWALQSMVLAYKGGIDDGQYAITIDDDAYTVTVTGASAHLAYGPPTQEPLLHVHCSSNAFFRLATTNSTDDLILDNGSPHVLDDFVRSFPLEIGPRATA